MPIITLDIPAPQATRVAVALGKELNLRDESDLPRDATLADYKAWLIDVTRRMVMGVEHREEIAAVPVPPTVTID